MIPLAKAVKALTAGAVLSLMSLGAQAADLPKTLHMAAAFPAGVENAWVGAWMDSFNKFKEEKPDGVDIDLAYTENVYGDKGLTVLEEYASSGKYDIIWAHSAFSDEVAELKDEYKDILFVTVGAGNRPLGDNSYLIYMHGFEASYLTGVLSGKITKSNKLGVVGLFPADDVNDQINGFRAGAKSVNPDIKVAVTFIESWYDPVKAAEAANAQMAAGADIIYQLGESFEACRDHDIMCIGNYIDSNSMAPDAIPTSTLVYWRPQLHYIFDQWKNHKTTGAAYAAPMEPVWFHMAEGGGDIAPYHSFEDKIPAEVKDLVAKTREDIISGALKLELDMSLPVSD